MLGNTTINKKNHLEAAGTDLVELAGVFGTPLYVMDEGLIRKNCAAYRDGFKAEYPKSEVVFAGKAFLNKAMCCLIQEEGLSLDVASGGEMYTALKVDFPPEKIYFHGNNKTPEEIKMALEAGVGRIIVDSLDELDLLNSIAKKMNLTAAIYLRVKPGVEAHTHEYIQTGQLDSKFGLGLSDGQALAFVKKTHHLKNVALKGIHCHIGSQVFDLKPFSLAASLMMDFIKEIKDSIGVTLGELDLGGGFGIRYTEDDNPPLLKDYLSLVARTVKKKAAEHGLPLPKLLVEPGRSIVGEAGITLYTVGTVKNLPGIRKYVAVDGGMMDNLRPALYQAKYTAVVANKAGDPPAEVVTIAGKACESGDILIKDIALPSLQRGDIVAVLSTGAYHYSMANNYNRFGRPAVVFISGGRPELVVKRESYEDIVQNDLIPLRLCRQNEAAAGS